MVQDMDAYGLRMETPLWRQGNPIGIARLGWYSEILLGDRKPDSIQLRVSPAPVPGKVHIVFWGNLGESSADQNRYHEILKAGTTHLFTVPVKWDRGRPRTRFEPCDNFRLITLEVATGHFEQRELGVFTRGSRIFGGVQDQWSGGMQEVGGHIVYVTSKAHYAYPGAPPYSTLWNGVVPTLEQYARDLGVNLSATHVSPKWNPGPPPPQDQNFPERLAVLYFSPVAGHGRFIREEAVIRFCEDGELPNEDGIVFCHYSKLPNPPIGVAPMGWVHTQVEKAQEGQLYAPIRTCRQAA